MRGSEECRFQGKGHSIVLSCGTLLSYLRVIFNYSLELHIFWACALRLIFLAAGKICIVQYCLVFISGVFQFYSKELFSLNQNCLRGFISEGNTVKYTLRKVSQQQHCAEKLSAGLNYGALCKDTESLLMGLFCDLRRIFNLFFRFMKQL